jgi:hypothetical protein
VIFHSNQSIYDRIPLYFPFNVGWPSLKELPGTPAPGLAPSGELPKPKRWAISSNTGLQEFGYGKIMGKSWDEDEIY